MRELSSFDKLVVEKLKTDHEFAEHFTRETMEWLNDPEERGTALLALRSIAQAHGGLGKIAAEAGISRESLYRALSPKGNPTLKTLLAVLRSVGMRLSVEPAAAAPMEVAAC